MDWSKSGVGFILLQKSCSYKATTTDLSVGELVRILRQFFTSYGVAEEFTSDGATIFTGHVFEEFCKTWGVWQRVSSAHHPHSNLQTEVAALITYNLDRS